MSGFWTQGITRDIDSSVVSSTNYSEIFYIELQSTAATRFYIKANIFLDNDGRSSVGYKFKLKDFFGMTTDYSFNGEVKCGNYSKNIVSTGTAQDMFEITDATQALEKGSLLEITGYMYINQAAMNRLQFHLAQGTSSTDPIYIRQGSFVTIKKV